MTRAHRMREFQKLVDQPDGPERTQAIIDFDLPAGPSLKTRRNLDRVAHVTTRYGGQALVVAGGWVLGGALGGLVMLLFVVLVEGERLLVAYRQAIKRAEAEAAAARAEAEKARKALHELRGAGRQEQ